MEEKLKEFLEKEGYSLLKEIPGRGVCGIKEFMFTTAIVYGFDSGGYIGRFCYPKEPQHLKTLALAYQIWDGVEDPIGPWIKHKGTFEYSNPNLEEKT